MNKVVSIRKALGETQDIFAHRFDVSVTTIRKWEAGAPMASKYQRILDKLIEEFNNRDVNQQINGNSTAENSTMVINSPNVSTSQTSEILDSVLRELVNDRKLLLEALRINQVNTSRLLALMERVSARFFDPSNDNNEEENGNEQ